MLKDTIYKSKKDLKLIYGIDNSVKRPNGKITKTWIRETVEKVKCGCKCGKDILLYRIRLCNPFLRHMQLMSSVKDKLIINEGEIDYQFGYDIFTVDNSLCGQFEIALPHSFKKDTDIVVDIQDKSDIPNKIYEFARGILTDVYLSSVKNYSIHNLL